MEFSWFDADDVPPSLLKSYEAQNFTPLSHYPHYSSPYFQYITDNSSISFIYGVLFNNISIFYINLL